MTARSNVVRYARSLLVQIGELPSSYEKIATVIPKECAKGANNTQTSNAQTNEQSRWSIRSLNQNQSDEQSGDRWRNNNRDDSRGYSNNRRNLLETETDATPAWFDESSTSQSGGFTFDSRPDWVEQAERELESARMKWKAEEEPSHSELKLKQINQSINHSIKHAEEGALNVDESEAERVRLALEALNQANNQSLDDIHADFDDIDARLAAKAKADLAAATPAAFDTDRPPLNSAMPSSSSNILRGSSPPPPGFSANPSATHRIPAQQSQVILEAPSAKRAVDPFMNDGIFGTFGPRPVQSKPEQQATSLDPWTANQSITQNINARGPPDTAKSLWDLPSQINQPQSFPSAQSQSRQPVSANHHINSMHNMSSGNMPPGVSSSQSQPAVQPWVSQPDAVAYRIAPQDFFRAFADQQHAPTSSNDNSHLMNQASNSMHMQHPSLSQSNMNNSPPGFQQQMMSQQMHHQSYQPTNQSYQSTNVAPESDDPISKLVSRTRARKAGVVPNFPAPGYGMQPSMQSQYPPMQSMNNQPINQQIGQPKPHGVEASFNPFAGMPQSSYDYPNSSSFPMMNKQSNDQSAQIPHGYQQSMPQQQHSHLQQQYAMQGNPSVNHAHQQTQVRQMQQMQHQAPFNQPFNSPSPPLPAFFQNQQNHQQPRY